MLKIKNAIRHSAVKFADFAGWLTIVDPRFLDSYFRNEGHVRSSSYADLTEVGWPYLLKRSVDLASSILALVLFAPLLVVIAAAIKLTSPGPVFYPQKRIGLNTTVFWMYRFRTMVGNEEPSVLMEFCNQNEARGAVFKIVNDARITPVGKILRRTSLDELPQLFNVLKGDMSLVGPRPLPVRSYEAFAQEWKHRRFSVRPGITSLWQINRRSTVTFDEWMKLDLQYVDKWSFWLDVKILASTLKDILTGYAFR